MVDTISLAGMGSNVSASRTTQSVGSSSESFTVSETSASQGVQQISPSMHTDPATGVLVTEYFSSSGEVQMQFPSQAVLAYLRSGLTAAGLPKDKPQQTSLRSVAEEQPNVIA